MRSRFSLESSWPLARLVLQAGICRCPPKQPHPREDSEHPPIWWQIALYGTLLASMLANRYLRFQNGGTQTAFLRLRSCCKTPLPL
jgi:hypothetical protein